MGRVESIVFRGQPHLPTRNTTIGNPTKALDVLSVIMKVIDLMLCREVGWGDRRILLMFQTA